MHSKPVLSLIPGNLSKRQVVKNCRISQKTVWAMRAFTSSLCRVTYVSAFNQVKSGAHCLYFIEEKKFLLFVLDGLFIGGITQTNCLFVIPTVGFSSVHKSFAFMQQLLYENCSKLINHNGLWNPISVLVIHIFLSKFLNFKFKQWQ